MTRWIKRWFGTADKSDRANTDIPALPPKHGDALDAWHAQYDEWVHRMEDVFEAFPDHSALDGYQLKPQEMNCLHEITNAYLNEGREMLEILVLRNESLRRHIARRRTEGVEPKQSGE